MVSWASKNNFANEENKGGLYLQEFRYQTEYYYREVYFVISKW